MMYLAYAVRLFKWRPAIHAETFETMAVVHKFERRFSHIGDGARRDVFRLFFGIIAVLVSSDIIVRVSKLIAVDLGVPLFVIGLILLAIGTSLPEMVLSYRSIKRHETGIFFGNMLGSTIANSTLVIGLTAIIRPIAGATGENYNFAAFAFLLIISLFWYFSRSKHRLDRWEALILVIIYVVFATSEVVV